MSRTSLSNFDRYNLGVQLLQIRPVWLLLSGFVFVSFIIFCSWFIRTDGQASGVALNDTSLNHSTNQSVAPDAALASTVEPEVKEATHEVATQDASLAPVETEAKQSPSGETVETASETQPAQETQSAKEAQPAREAQPAKVAAPAPAEAPVESAVTVQSFDKGAGRFTVQVGSYNDRGQAEARVATLQSAGFDARAVSVEIPKRGTWYRVQTGRFASRDEATRFGAQLRAKGVAETVLVAETQAN